MGDTTEPRTGNGRATTLTERQRTILDVIRVIGDHPRLSAEHS